MASGFGNFRNAVSVTDVIHDRIHQGTFFQSNNFEAAVANNGTLEMLVRVTTGAHLRWSANVGGDSLGTFYNGPTLTDDGTALSAVNFNTFSSLTAVTEVYDGPTYSDPGTPVLENIFIPGGSKGQVTGGSGGAFEEFVLGPGDYLGRLQNISGNNNVPLQIIVHWYEPQGRVAVLGGD